MRNIFTFSLIVFSLVSLSVSAQNQQHHNDNGHPNKWCSSVEMTKKYIEQNNLQEEYAIFLEEQKTLADDRMRQIQLKGTQAIRTIPVVVHILFNPNDTGSEPDVPDSDILDMIAQLNSDFTRTNSDASDTRPEFVSVAGNTQLNFCLATKDPNGNPTTGIVRYTTTKTTFGDDEMKSTATDGANSWDAFSYLNIWVADISNGAGGGTAGYAYLPTGGMHGTPNMDGLVLDSDIGIGLWGGQVNRTATHEIGHYFGLNHTWGDYLTCTSDDGFTDTPTTSSDNMDVYNCTPSTPPNTCNDGAGDKVDQYENFMSYATCQNMFSAMQANYMNSILDGTRSSLLASNACGAILTADFAANQTTIFAGQNVNFTDLSTPAEGETISARSWNFTGGSPSTSSAQNPSGIVYSTPGSYAVSLTVTDPTGTDTETKTAYIIVQATGNLTADFYASNTLITPGTSINFTDASTGGAPIQWTWSFSGGSPSSSFTQNPTGITFNTIGSYNVTLTVTDGNTSNTLTKPAYIVVSDTVPLVADFIANQTNITTDQKVNFTDLSSGGPVSWAWSFTGGTPNASTAHNPTNIAYTTVGTYDVRLIATKSATVKDTLVKPGYITVTAPIPPEALFSGTPTYIGVGDFVDFTDLSMNAPIQWKWTFTGGTPASSTAQNPSGIVYNTPGQYDVRLIVTNSAGVDTLLQTLYITVVDPVMPDADFIANNTVVQVDDSIKFTDLTTNSPTAWSWTLTSGNPATSIVQNPENIYYTSSGYYDVKLIATNPNGSNTELKTSYIRVLGPDSIGASFIASATVIAVGDSINYTDYSVGIPESWDWTFEGGTPATDTIQNPQSIKYNTAGLYKSKLIIQKGGQIDSLVRDDYILVLAEGSAPPQADFYAAFTTIYVGNSTSFTDVSIDNPESWIWQFEGANPSVSALQNPSVISYDNPGYYDVTLIVANEMGADTMIKEDYIHVIWPDSLTSGPDVDFVASQRLIPMGTKINFADSSSGEPTSWFWTFEMPSGAFLTSTLQNPGQILYTTPGLWNVKLVATNYLGSDSLTKSQYIVVSDTAWADPRGYCDTITNQEGYITTFYNLDYTWGYFPGHNGDKIKAYADRYVNYTFSEISSIIVPVKKTIPGSNGAYVRFKIWEGDDYPTNEITSKKIQLADLYPNTYSNIEFDSVIPIDGIFFVGFEVRYDDVAQDTFVVSMEPDRGANQPNSLYLLRSSVWRTPYEYADNYNHDDLYINTALGIRIIGCLVGIDEVNYDPNIEILVYPNPSNGSVNLYFGSLPSENMDYKVFNMMGRLVNVTGTRDADNHYQLDFSNVANGIYFINIRINDQFVTKKVSIVR